MPSTAPSVATDRILPAQPSKEISVVFGLTQPLVTNGFNFEIDFWTKRWVFDYSHGFGLEFKGDLVSKHAKEQRLAFNISHSLGIGIGYRITKGFNLRLEPKLHIWEMYYDNSFKTKSGKIKTYNTYTLGLGAYYRWQPFHKKESALRGITIAPSFRWWPNVHTTLNGNNWQYFNTVTAKTETHKANNIGVSNTAFFMNLSVGYTFDLRRHQNH